MAAIKKQMVQGNSTLAIDAETSMRLKLFCDKFQMTKKDYIKESLAYFERTGVDIRSSDTANNMEQITTYMQEIRLKQDTIQSQMENNRKDTQLAKKQNETIFSIINQQQELIKQLAETQQQQTKLIEQQTKQKKHWWNR